MAKYDQMQECQQMKKAPCCAGIANAFLTISRVEGGAALLKGLKPALIGIAPYAALNFASYDLLKHAFFGADARCVLSVCRPLICLCNPCQGMLSSARDGQALKIDL